MAGGLSRTTPCSTCSTLGPVCVCALVLCKADNPFDARFKLKPNLKKERTEMIYLTFLLHCGALDDTVQMQA